MVYMLHDARPMMRLVLILSVLVAGVGSAAASLCNLEPVTLDVPVNCSIELYNQAGTSLPDIRVTRTGVETVVQPEIISSLPADLEVSYSDRCDGELVYEHRIEPYDIVKLRLPGAQVGDTFQVEGQGQGGRISDAGTCRPVEWQPWCSESNAIDCDAARESGALDDGGCAAGGTTGILASLPFLLALRRRARR
jgi:hypothetical protein